jgi:hypothetical protein
MTVKILCPILFSFLILLISCQQVPNSDDFVSTVIERQYRKGYSQGNKPMINRSILLRVPYSRLPYRLRALHPENNSKRHLPLLSLSKSQTNFGIELEKHKQIYAWEGISGKCT